MTTSLIAVAVCLSLAAAVAPQKGRVAKETAEELARRADELLAKLPWRTFTRVPRTEALRRLETEVAKSVVLYDTSRSRSIQSPDETKALTDLVGKLRSTAEILWGLNDYAELGITNVSWEKCEATLTLGILGTPAGKKTFDICKAGKDAKAIPTMLEKLGY